MFKIGNVLIKNGIVIAPMAGVSNIVFRELCLEYGAGMVCSEMVSDKALYFNNYKTSEILMTNDFQHPLSMQLFGYDIDTMVLGAKYLDDNTNCDIIDINMGCPVNKIVKSKGGSYLLKDQKHAIELVRAVVGAVKKPVSVKMRIGYDHSYYNYLYLSQEFEKLGVACIILHGRTKSDLYSNRANWEHVKLLKKHLKIPVIGNGDINSLDDYIKYKELTNCDGIMIGRGVIGNPFLIREIDAYINNYDFIKPSYQQIIDCCLSHCLKLIDVYKEDRAVKIIRGLSLRYIKGLPYNISVKKDLVKVVSYTELENILYNYLSLLNKEVA